MVRTIVPVVILWILLYAASLALAQPQAGWQPAAQESFARQGWEADWTLKGAGPTDRQALLGGGKELTARLNNKLTAPALRVEYDAAMLAEGPDGAVSDLSCFIGNVLFRFGGENNTLSDIRANGHFLAPPKPVVFEMKTAYRVVAEVNGRRCALTVDGLPAGEMLLDAPLKEAVVTLYTWTGRSRFTNLRVYTKPEADPVPERLLAAARMADRLAAEEDARPAVDAMTPGELRHAPTIHAIGFEWDLLGDANHNASCAVRYRVKGAPEWSDALGLLRIDYRGWYGREPGKAPDLQAFRRFNMLAGSLMFLEPATTYEVELLARDPDGGGEKRTVEITTRAVPVLAAPKRVLHVVPGDGGGDGTKDAPFRGIEAADQGQARGNQVVYLHRHQPLRVIGRHCGSSKANASFGPRSSRA